jgi:hypothetical protein
LSVYVYKPLPPGIYPIAVGKYINNNNINLCFRLKKKKVLENKERSAEGNKRKKV